MMRYVNTGAPFQREDGTEVESGAIFTPTDKEVRQYAYKLEPVDGAPPEAPITAPELAPGVWPMTMKPEKYLRLHPKGAHAELAQSLVDAAAAERLAAESTE